MSGAPARDQLRSLAMVRAFGPAIQRAQIIGALVATVLAVAWLLVGGETASTMAMLPIAAAVAGVAGTIAAFASVPRRVHRAFEAFSWLGRAEIDRFQARTGSGVPTSLEELDPWLASQPAAPSLLLPRVEILAFGGRFDEARRELAMVQPDPATAFERASLAQYVGWLETGEPGLAELRQAASATPPGTRDRRMADVTVALAEARALAVAGDPGWVTPLETIRNDLGGEPWPVVLRDTWIKAALGFTLVALIAAIGTSLLRSVL